MALKFPDDSTALDVSLGEEADYRVSTAPIIPARNGGARAEAGEEFTLPRSYGLETLWLLPRDPHSLFAYWDIDWQSAFQEENPRPRKVQLRIFDQEGAEQAALEVEPMAGHCRVRVPTADTTYRAEIGFATLEGDWQLVTRSESVFVPPEVEGNFAPADFATVPLHLSFQRLLDATRVAQEENLSLTDTLADLRQRPVESMNAETREVVRAVEEAATRAPQPAAASGGPDLWAQHRLEEILGFGHSSLSRAFGGSSR